MRKRSAIYLLLVAGSMFTGLSAVTAQTGPDRKTIAPKPPLIYRSDTLPVMSIPEVKIFEANRFNYLKSWRYRRTIYNVKKAYPYAVIANEKLKELDADLSALNSKRKQKDYMDEAEKTIMEEFEGDLRKLTITQGIILVKLIDREVGQTSYEVIKDIKGGFTAFFWQGVARIFGNNLKLQYDPTGEDRVIEDIIMAMEFGVI